MMFCKEKIEESDFYSYIKGAVMGHIVGDALGFPYHNKPSHHMPNTISMIKCDNRLPGVYTENSCLMLCTMANMLNFNNKDLDDIYDIIQAEELMGIFRDVYIGGYLMPNEESELRSVTSEAIKNYMSGLPPDRSGMRNVLDNTNDALTRILPIGLYYSKNSIDIIIEKAHQITAITHDEFRSKVCSAIYCLLIRQIIVGTNEKVLDLLEDYYKIKKMHDYSSALKFIRDSKTKVFAGGSKVNDCFWSAWKAYADNQEEYRPCVAAAIRYGNESHSTACVAGGLSGLTCGVEEIPQKWIDALNLSNEIKEIIENFVRKVVMKIGDN